MNVQFVQINGDSQLAIKQLTGEYHCLNENIV